MQTLLRQILAVLAIAVLTGITGLCDVPHAAAADDATKSSPPPPTRATPKITGSISYRADKSRRWRYARYYVDRKTHRLSGSLVCLTGAGLKDAAPKHKPETIVVDQKELRFTPEATVLRAGDRIRFTNSDPGTHNVNSKRGLHPFDVTLAFGEEAVETFPRAGGARRPVVLGCSFHGSMRAWIYVFDHPWYGLTERDGQFDFSDVPPGRYRLQVVHPAGQLYKSRLVEIKPNEHLEIDVELSPDDLDDAKQ